MGIEANLIKNMGKDAPTAPDALKSRIDLFIDLYREKVPLNPQTHVAFTTLKLDLKNHSLTEITQKYAHSSIENAFFKEIIALASGVSQEECNSLIKRISSEQFSWAPVNRDEMLRILIHLKKLDCAVIQYYELSDFIEHKMAALKGKQNASFQALVRHDVHYTALHFEYADGKVRCAVLDANQDPKLHLLVKVLSDKNIPTYVLGENEEDKLQLDNRSCSIFSLDHLIQVAKDPQFFSSLQMLATSSEKGYPVVAWEKLNPSYVKNAQSKEFLLGYLSKHPNESFKGADFVEVMRKRWDEKSNLSIQRKLDKYTQRVTAFLSNNSPGFVASIAFKSPFN